MRKMLLATAAVLGLSVSPAHADLIGNTVNLSYFFPTLTHLVFNEGTQTVPAVFALSNAGAGTSVTVTGNQIIANMNPPSPFQWAPAAFNGWVLTDLTNVDITDVTIASETNFDLTDADISFTANTITVNWQGLQVGTGGNPSSFVLDVTTVPEPATLALLSIGLVGLGAVRRRRAA